MTAAWFYGPGVPLLLDDPPMIGPANDRLWGEMARIADLFAGMTTEAERISFAVAVFGNIGAIK